MMILFYVVITIIASTPATSSITETEVRNKLRLLRPAITLIESLFDAEDQNMCLEKLLCHVETEMPDDEVNPLKYYSQFFTNKYHDFEDTAFREVQSVLGHHPKLMRIVESIEIGRNTTGSQTCDQQYPRCGASASELLSYARAYSDSSIAKSGGSVHVRAERGAVCAVGGVICGAAVGGCFACAIFTFGICGVACGTGVEASCIGAAGLCSSDLDG